MSEGSLCTTAGQQQNPPAKQNGEKSIENGSSKTYIVRSRAEILAKRKERNKSKKEAKAIQRDAKFLNENLIKKSDKIKTLRSEDFDKIQAVQSIVQQKSTKSRKQPAFNILDFVVSKAKTKDKLKLLNVEKKKPMKRINRGKKREIQNKSVRTRLKKAIIRSRNARHRTNECAAEADDTKTDLENIKLEDSEERQIDTYPVKDISTNESSEVTHSGAIDCLEESVNKLDKLNLNEIGTTSEKSTNIHSRKFRGYCNNLTSPTIRSLTENLIRKVYGFQKRAHLKNEIKAKAHRRYVIGFKETKRYLMTNKIRLVIIAPDCEECDGPDGIGETIDWIKNKCDESEVPYLFSLRARQIAYCMFIKVPINCLGIISYDGAQDIFADLINSLATERENYLKAIKENNNLNDTKS